MSENKGKKEIIRGWPRASCSAGYSDILSLTHFSCSPCVPRVQVNAQYSTRAIPVTALSGYELSYLILPISYSYILYYNHFTGEEIEI